MLAAAFFGSGLSLVGAGIAVGRLGSRAAMTAGTLVAAGALTAGALADTAVGLAASLGVFGIGSSVVTIAGVGAPFGAYTAERRAWALGVRQMAVPLGGTIGAVLVPAVEAVGGVSTVLFTGAAAVGLSGAAFAVAADSVPAAGRRGAFARSCERRECSACLSALATPPLGALAEHAGWDAFWLTTSALALAGSVVAATLPRL